MSQLWAWGANSCGQLGLGDKCEQHEEPVPVPLLPQDDPVIQVAGGGSHTLLLTQAGRVYGAGSNARGQLGGAIATDTSSFQPVTDIPPNSNISRVAAGWDFSFVVTADGDVYAAGSNAFGQLGTGDDGQDRHSFTRVTSLPGIADVRC